MAEPSSLNRTLDRIAKFSGTGYREWRSKMRQAIGFYSPDMLRVLDGIPRPTASANNTEEIAKWDKASENLFSVLFFVAVIYSEVYCVMLFLFRFCLFVSSFCDRHSFTLNNCVLDKVE